jgi:4'-phosphopantetheinyl transferase
VSVSLSHTDDVVLFAIARDRLVGVDVERLAADIDPDLLAPRVLHPDEARAMHGFTGEAQRRAFLRVWCRKEAALKVTGIGLLDDLTTLSVMSNDVDLGACKDPRVTKDDARVVHIQDLALDDAHQAALAVG